ncbi:MAG: spheroidene monooxygenase [Pseudomonadota bacterium]
MENEEIVTLSFFSFEGLSNKLWAFGQMGFAHRHMANLPGVRFYKLFGSGSGESFTPWPNFGVYAIMAVWPSLEEAKQQTSSAAIYRRYQNHSTEHGTVYLSAYQVRGEWDGNVPFIENKSLKGTKAPEPIGVLTRATIRKRALLSFWRRAPAISEATTHEGDLLLKRGIGEIPWLHQVTFSIWSNRAAMVRFAHQGGCHALAAKAAFDKGWFSESLFARFAVVDTKGTWEGKSLETLVSRMGERV